MRLIMFNKNGSVKYYKKLKNDLKIKNCPKLQKNINFYSGSNIHETFYNIYNQ